MVTRCSNASCRRAALWRIEFSAIDAPERSTMQLCDDCWRELIERMGIELRALSKERAPVVSYPDKGHGGPKRWET